MKKVYKEVTMKNESGIVLKNMTHHEREQQKNKLKRRKTKNERTN